MAGKGRDTEVRDFDKFVKHLVVEGLPLDHPLDDVQLLEQFIEGIHDQLTLKHVAPDLAGHGSRGKGKPTPEACRYLFYRSLRAKKPI